MSDKPKDHKPEEKKPDDLFSDVSSKIPDLSSITKKIDLDKILRNIKSMISPEDGGVSVKVDPRDALGMKVTELSALLEEISKTHKELSKDFSKANELLLGLFKDLEVIRHTKKEE